MLAVFIWEYLPLEDGKIELLHNYYAIEKWILK